MDYFIAFLKYFTDVRVKKCPFCTQQWLIRAFFRILRKNARNAISRKRHFWSPNRKIPENRPPQSTPQNLRKLTSETTFGHSKVVFRPLLRTKCTFSQNPPMSRFKFFLVIPDTFSIPKSLTEVMGDLIFLKTRSRPMCSVQQSQGNPILSNKGAKRGPFWSKRGPKIRIFQNCFQGANMLK